MASAMGKTVDYETVVSDSLKEIRKGIEDLKHQQTRWQMDYVAVSAQREAAIESLRESDTRQWAALADLGKKEEEVNSRLLRVSYLIMGAVSILVFFDLPSKIKTVLGM
jgi:hypothetical protein